jgi:putative membrane protein
MSIRLTRNVARSVVVLSGCTLWVACAKGGDKADSAAAADSAARAATAATPAAAPAPALTDAGILALLDEANAGDSTTGKMASTKGTAATVKEFGRDMMRDHHKLRKDGQDLAKKLKITPAPPTGDTLPASLQRATDSMTATPKGAAWDKWYIDHEVAAHQSVLSLLQAAQAAAQDTSLKGAIAKATPVVQAHLTKAQSIQGKLPAATPAAAGAGSKATPPTDTTKKKP